MKVRKATPFLLVLFAFTSGCGDVVDAKDVLDSGKQALGNLDDMDLGSLSLDDMKDKVGSLADTLGSKLAGIKDEAGAIDASKAVGPLLDQLTKLKGSLGDSMPGLDQLGGIVRDLETRFGGDAGIMKVLKPILDKVQGLLR